MSAALIDISILIVNYKSWNHLEKCLDSIKTIKTEHLTFEVVVVDNCSNDSYFTQFKKRFTTVKFIKNSGNNGFSNGCNLAAEKARGSHYLFLNPDTLISSDVLLKLLEVSNEHPEIKLLSCDKKTKNGNFERTDKPFPSFGSLFGVFRIFHKILNTIKPKKIEVEQPTLVYPKWLSGSLVFMKKSWFEHLNGWNQDYWMYYEDVDLSKRTADLGGKIGLTKAASIVHNHGGSSRINVKTTALTKSEVIISRHVYIQNHFKGWQGFFSHAFLFVSVLIEKFIFAVVGVFLFFIPKLFVQVHLFGNLISYYINVLIAGSWLSKRSLNYKKSAI